MTARIAFRDIFERVERPISVAYGEEYQCVGVRWWGKGAFVRETKRGEEILKKRQYRLQADDIVYNKLFAWRGAFAVADASVDGCIVSDKFPTYRLISDRVLPSYLRVLFQSSGLAAQAGAKSTGMASLSKFTLNPPRFWELTVPIPEKEEQIRIVKDLERLDERADTVSRALTQIIEDCSRLVAAETDTLTRNCERMTLGSLGKINRRSITVRDDITYKQVTIGLNNTGVRLRGLQAGFNIGVKNQALVMPGDLVFSRIDIRNGAIGFVPDELEGAIVANDFPVFEVSPLVYKPYLAWYIRTPDFRQQSMRMSAGTTNRRKMKRDNFLELQVPLPDLQTQMAITDRLDEVYEQTGAIRAACSRVLDDVEKMRRAVVDHAFSGAPLD